MTRLETINDTQSHPVSIGAADFAAAQVEQTAEVGDLGRILWRHRVLIGLTTAVLIVAAVLASLLIPPLYTATAQILVDPRDRQVMTKDINPTTVAADGGVAQVESQTRVIESSSVLLRAIAATGLAQDPEFGPVPGTGLAALANAVTTAALTLVGFPHKALTPEEIDAETLTEMKRRLSVKRADKVFVIDITFTAKSAEKAARLANAIADAYLADQNDARERASHQVSESLVARLDEQRQKVRQAEDRVERYRTQNDLVGTSGRLVTEQQLSDVNVQLSAAQNRIAELKARVDQIDQVKRAGLSADSTAEAIQSSVISKLRAQYAELVAKDADLKTQFGERYPPLISVAAQMENVGQLITAELARIGRAARADYDRAVQNERAIAANLNRLKSTTESSNQASVQLRELEREADAARAVYTSFLNRAGEVREQGSIDTTNARIVTRADPPQKMSWPLPLYFILGALASGLGLGSGFAMTREYAAPTVLSRNQLQRLCHNVPVIGTVPSLDPGEPAEPRRSGKAPPAGNPAAVGLALGRLLGLRSGRGGASRFVMIVSGTQDSRETGAVTARFAVAAGEQVMNVLIVDLKTAEAAASPGMAEVLRGEAVLDSVLRRDPGTDLYWLDFGTPRRGAAQSEAAAALKRFLNDLGRRFDLVLFDGGAIAENLRVAPIALLVDDVVLVARLGATRQRDVIDAAEAAAQAGRPISAALLIDPSART